VKIRNISIRGLFGTFDHHIPLFQQEPITIIHGPNGVGKTSILRLIYGSLWPAYSHLRHVPFQDLELNFENDVSLLVSPVATSDTEAPRMQEGRRRSHRPPLLFRLRRAGEIEHEYTHSGTSQRGRLEHRLDLALPFLRRLGPDEWFDTNTDRMLTLEDVIQVYGVDLPEEFRAPEEPDWLRDIQRTTPVHFIETQRLLYTRPLSRPHSHGLKQQSAVERCSAEFANHIKSTLARSATLSQSLERTFPARLISEEGPVPLTEKEIRTKLTDLDKRRSRLVEAGLLDPGLEPALPAKRFDETTQRVLAVYIRDTEHGTATRTGVQARVVPQKRDPRHSRQR
jgi:hypothetical protein